MKLLVGRGRKASLPFFILSVIGWSAYVAGFGWLVHHGYENTGSGAWFPFCCFAAVGPLLYLLAFVQLMSGKQRIGIPAHFCSAVFLVAAGGVLYVDGLIITQIALVSNGTVNKMGVFITLEFAGCLAASFFWAIYMMCWPFFEDVNYTNHHMPLMTMRSTEGPKVSARNAQYSPTTSPTYLPTAHSHSVVMTPIAFAASAGGSRPGANATIQSDRPASWNKETAKLPFAQMQSDDV